MGGCRRPGHEPIADAALRHPAPGLPHRAGTDRRVYGAGGQEQVGDGADWVCRTKAGGAGAQQYDLPAFSGLPDRGRVLLRHLLPAFLLERTTESQESCPPCTWITSANPTARYACWT